MNESGAEMLNAAGKPFGELIRQYRKRKKLSQEQLGAIVNVKKNAVGAWEAGRSRPDIASIPDLCQALEIPLYTFFGVRPPVAPEKNLVTEKFERLTLHHQQIALREMDMLYDLQKQRVLPSARRLIPLYLNELTAAAGPVSYLGDSGGEMVWIAADDMTSRADEMIRVSGDSMQPTFEDGDIALVQHCSRLKPGEIGIFINGDAGYIKEYRRDGLYSHNRKYEPIRFSENDSVRCVGRVLGKLRPEQRATPEEIAQAQENQRGSGRLT